MTVPISDRLSQLYVGNDINQRFDFTFRVFNQESESGIVVRQKTAIEFVTLDPSLYTVTLNQDSLGGHIDFITPPESNVYFYIAGATALDQLLDITNYDNFYPDAIERALDKLTALLQEWGTQLDQEKQARILADIHYDSLAMEREENLENRLISYINAVVGITNPKIFDGISDRMVITRDGRTQREFNESIPFWTEDYVSFKQETYLREEQILDHVEEINNQTTQALNAETLRALTAEASINATINAIGVGNKAYLTYAAMDADKANIPAKSKVTVTNDSTSSNNGDWQWDGATFTKSVYDPITQAVNQSKSYTDVQIKELNFVRGVNIFDKSKVEYSKYYDYLTGEKGDATAEYVAAGLYEIQGNTEYRVPDDYDQQFAFFNSSGVFISGLVSAGATHKFITPSNAKYIGLTVPNSQLNSLVVSESSLYPTSYLPYSAKKINGLIVDDVKTTEINVSADLNDTSADFTGQNAIQLALNSITDATSKNRYVIKSKGFFKADQANEVIGYPGYPSMILAKDHVDIIGDGNTIVHCELPYDDTEIGPSPDGNVYPRIQYQTLYTYAQDALIKDITFIAKNIRYALHLDNINGANKKHFFRNTSFIFKGDKGSAQALGCGTSTGEETYFESGRFHSDVGAPFYCHNNSKFEKPSLFSFKDCDFSSNINKVAISLQSDGSLVKDKLEIIGCSFTGSAYTIDYSEAWLRKNISQNYDSFNHAEWMLVGFGNQPFLFDNRVGGSCLYFRSNGTGTDKTIRFDKTSSAYPVLIKNNQANADVSLYLDSREYLDGYIIQDGSIGLSAQAWGCVDVSETAGLYDSGIIYTSMGKRLGNCSTSNKSLGVIINGATYTVTFNKDYSSMSNAAILSEVNAALVGVTADLYTYGRDYYPMMTDIAETVYNSSSTYISKGSIVTKSKGTVRLANANDKVYGVALDDIPVMTTTSEGVKKGQGRVLKRGYIYANQSKAHFVLADNQNPVVGTRFSVNNGQLVTDANGKISVDIDDGIVSINC